MEKVRDCDVITLWFDVLDVEYERTEKSIVTSSKRFCFDEIGDITKILDYMARRRYTPESAGRLQMKE